MVRAGNVAVLGHRYPLTARSLNVNDRGATTTWYVLGRRRDEEIGLRFCARAFRVFRSYRRHADHARFAEKEENQKGAQEEERPGGEERATGSGPDHVQHTNSRSDRKTRQVTTGRLSRSVGCRVVREVSSARHVTGRERTANHTRAAITKY